ncbi:MAG: efflux RND transporter periplasmic adaptor subunit [Myxococcaceae bacterium]
MNRGLIFVCVVFGLLSGCTKPSASSKNLGSAAYGDLIQRVTVPGVVSANKKTTFTAPYPGYVKKIYVQVGQKVSAGDPIISLVQSLRNPDDEVYPLRAPFSGTVVQILKTEGEYVEQYGTTSGMGGSAPANAMVRIDDLSKLFVEATAPEIDVDKLKEGQEVLFKSSALLGHSYKGKIKSIFLAAKEQSDSDRSKVEFAVRIEVLNADGHLKPGMSVIVDIITKQLIHVLMLRHEFIQKEGNQYFVTLQNGSKRKIEVGVQNEEVFEILKGLKEGEKVQQTDFLSIIKAGKP